MTSALFEEEQQFEKYFEQGTFTLERPVSKTLFYDAGVLVRAWRGLHAGAALSVFDDTGEGEVTARVPHPFFFNQQRAVEGRIPGVMRREMGQHVVIGWAFPATRGLQFVAFGGPSVFTTEQRFVTSLVVSLDTEVYPFDTLAFPETLTETLKKNIVGYNAGVDMTWRFARVVGLGVLVRYSKGQTELTPTGGTPVDVEVGGLHTGAGLRLMF